MIVKSLLDNDQYKFTMQQALLKLGYGAVPVRYKFKCRNKGIDFTKMAGDIFGEIMLLSELMLTRDEYDYMRSLPYISEEYLQFLKYYRHDPDLIHMMLEDDGTLVIEPEGSWFRTILLEVPILSIVSEVFGRYQPQENKNIETSRSVLKSNLAMLPDDLNFADFGTRRRHSYEWHDEVVQTCKKKKGFVGTSNVHFAMMYGLKPIGTMAHEWLMAHQQLDYRVADSQKMALENWIKVYRGNLGIALSDVINTTAFLRDFSDPLFYKLFDGVREDSEPNPEAFGRKMIEFYKSRKIDPTTKTVVFSNGLDFSKMMYLHHVLRYHINVSFGIGTKLTNAWEYIPLNIVLKMVTCNGQPVAKISNSPGKGMCESESYINYIKEVYGVK